MTQPLTSPDGTPASRLAFGAMQFGGKAGATQSRAMFEACRGAGINHFDTAWIYTGGASETLLGAMIRPERERLLIATKYGATGGAGRVCMTAQFDESRARLGLDMVESSTCTGSIPTPICARPWKASPTCAKSG